MHLDDETLERVLHDELDAVQEAAARAHLSGCPACSGALEASRRRESRVFGLLRALDHPAPDLDRRAFEPPAPRTGAGLPIAASIAFILAAGLLYAIPDSPLRGWIDRTARDAPLDEAGVEPGDPPIVSGLSIRPAGPFEVVFAAGQERGVVRVEMANTPEVEIRVLGAPVDLESEPARVTIGNLGSQSSYTIRLPIEGPSVTVRVGDAAVFVKSAGGLQTAAPRTGPGAYRIDLARPGS